MFANELWRMRKSAAETERNSKDDTTAPGGPAKNPRPHPTVKPSETGSSGATKGRGKIRVGSDTTSLWPDFLSSAVMSVRQSAYLRIVVLVIATVLYYVVFEPFVPTGAVRFVHSPMGDHAYAGNNQNAYRCLPGPILHYRTPFLDKVYEYPRGWSRIEFSETGQFAPIRTETANGHEVSVDLAVVYRLFPDVPLNSKLHEAWGKCSDHCECECATPSKGECPIPEGSSKDIECMQCCFAKAYGDFPAKFGLEWERRYVVPMIDRVVRDNVNRYHLNQIFLYARDMSGRCRNASLRARDMSGRCRNALFHGLDMSGRCRKASLHGPDMSRRCCKASGRRSLSRRRPEAA